MKINIIALAAFLFISAIAGDAIAVKGYKELKWGQTVKETKKTINDNSYCDVTDLNVNKDGIRVLACDNFDFGGTKRHAFFLSVNDKLLRIGIAIEADEIEPLIDIFEKKYKTHSGSLPEGGQYPSEAIGWDDDTILLKIIFPDTPVQAQNQLPQEPYATLIYTSPDFENKLREHKKKMLEKSIVP